MGNRVVVNGVGRMGKLALRAIIDNPNFDLVGVNATFKQEPAETLEYVYRLLFGILIAPDFGSWERTLRVWPCGEYTLADVHGPYTVLLRRNRRTNAAILKSRLTPSPDRR